MQDHRYYTHSNQNSQSEVHTCSWEGCEETAHYPAPRSPNELRSYVWFCLEHVKAYNKSWDFFSGKSDAEVEQFSRDALYGHRPTRPMGVEATARRTKKILEEIGKILGEDWVPREDPREQAFLPKELREALVQFDLVYPVGIKTIKKRYKELVKKYHPDVNGNDKASEERFKEVVAAYRLLIDSDFFSDV